MDNILQEYFLFFLNFVINIFLSKYNIENITYFRLILYNFN